MTQKVTYFLTGIIIGVGMAMAIYNHSESLGCIIGGCGFLILIFLVANEVMSD